MDEGEEEIEELLDDEPMRVVGRLFVGSIDAAVNVAGLRRRRIAGMLALLVPGEEEAVASQVTLKDEDVPIMRRRVALEDSGDGDLLRRLPGILLELEELLEQAERDDTNVLVHCVAGRSRSVAVLVAKMLTTDRQRSVSEVVDEIRMIRPWIEINPYFMQDLQLFHAVLTWTDGGSFSASHGAALKTRALPRLDFSGDLVDGILRGSKTITMRLVSDVEDDCNSDLGDIFPNSLVVATCGVHGDRITPRSPFAFLRVDLVETKALNAIDKVALHKSGFESAEELLAVLRQFYPAVTAATPLVMLHFHCLDSTK